MRAQITTARSLRRRQLRAACHTLYDAQREFQSHSLVDDVDPSNTRSGQSNEIITDSRTLCPRRLREHLQNYLPFDNFGSSRYSVPMLLVFRLFYQAAPYTASRALPQSQLNTLQLLAYARNVEAQPPKQQISATKYLSTHAQVNVNAFKEDVNANAELASGYRVITLTWVKALASPLSHEFVQIVVEHVKTGQRYRLVTDRTDVGDTVVVGWDWSSQEYASHHHVLPLPLLSLSFKDRTGPSLGELSALLSSVSNVQRYNLLREMCWWYAESIFTQMARKNTDAVVKQWPYASLRYSFVVQNEWINRGRLVKEAEKFRALIRNGMSY